MAGVTLYWSLDELSWPSSFDQYQGLGIGSALLRHLATLARGAGIAELIAEVMPDNTSMKVFEKCGFRLNTRRESLVVHVTLHLI